VRVDQAAQIGVAPEPLHRRVVVPVARPQAHGHVPDRLGPQHSGDGLQLVDRGSGHFLHELHRDLLALDEAELAIEEPVERVAEEPARHEHRDGRSGARVEHDGRQLFAPEVSVCERLHVRDAGRVRGRAGGERRLLRSRGTPAQDRPTLAQPSWSDPPALATEQGACRRAAPDARCKLCTHPLRTALEPP
jgi:hypothetical protein